MHMRRLQGGVRTYAYVAMARKQGRSRVASAVDRADAYDLLIMTDRGARAGSEHLDRTSLVALKLRSLDLASRSRSGEEPNCVVHVHVRGAYVHAVRQAITQYPALACAVNTSAD